ncbi:CWC16 protein [Pyronema omphalodes]|nr:CWC16 protein [Pyronema omphalodes]
MQGFNMGRYVPPEHEGVYSGNQLHKKKPAGFHGTKQTVRFEMPFGVFCNHCEGHIAQGVRFNAEKNKVGNYFSTPIFAFRMRHTVCAGWIEIRTDPKNTAYVVTEGAKQKEAEKDKEPNLIKVYDPNAPAIPDDPFAKKEKDVKDKTETKQGAARIMELQGLSERQWADPWEHSRKMRKVFRAERKVLEQKAATTEAIRDRAGLHIELLDEAPEDVIRAKMVEFGPDYNQKILDAQAKPLFSSKSDTNQPPPSSQNKGKLKRELAMEKTKQNLQKELLRNTRLAIDPFLGQQERQRTDFCFKLQKRKAREISPENQEAGDGDDKQSVEVKIAAKEDTIPETKAVPQTLSLGLDLDYSSSDEE